MFYVYLYLDPRTNVPFYVGKGMMKRAYDISSHTNKQVRGRIRILNELGLKHEVVIAECADEDHAFREEQKLIQCYGRRDLGLGSLLNHSNGGEGGAGRIFSEETKAKMRGPRAPYRRVMPYNKPPSCLGKIWITNGLIRRLHEPKNPMPIGFKRGM